MVEQLYCPGCNSETVHRVSGDGVSYDCKNCHSRNYLARFVEKSPRVELARPAHGVSRLRMIANDLTKLTGHNF